MARIPIPQERNTLYRRAMDDRTRFPPRPERPQVPPGAPPARAIALVLGAFAIALVVGYFLVMKLVDISRTEDCLMSGRRNCNPVDMR